MSTFALATKVEQISAASVHSNNSAGEHNYIHWAPANSKPKKNNFMRTEVLHNEFT